VRGRALAGASDRARDRVARMGPGPRPRRRAYGVICPTGKSLEIVSSPFGKNISLRRLLETPLGIPAVPPRIEGRIAIVTNVGCGMQWTRVAAQDGRRRSGRRSRVVLTPRRWRQLGDDCFGNRAGDGDKKPGSPGRARRKPLKPLRREGRASGEPVATNLRVFYFYTQGCGCTWASGFPCALYSGGVSFKPRAPSRRETAFCCPWLFDK
jgi:hypothetical protein